MSGDQNASASREQQGSPARRVDHVAIATRNADLAAEWYVRTLGMRVVGDEVVESAAVRLVYLAPDGTDPGVATMVQLGEPIGAGSMRDFVESRGEGLHHVCFAVDDIGRNLEALDQSDNSIFMGGRERRACFLEEMPLGVLIELTESLPHWARTAP